MKLEIELVGVYDKANTLVVDEKVVKLKKKDGNTRYAVVETEKSKVDVAMYKAHHYVGKHWFWWQLLYFFVSVFGIFDIKQDKSCSVVDCRFRLNLTQDTTKAYISICDVKEDKFAIIDTIAEIQEFSNKKYIDYVGVKRRNILKWIKIVIFLGCLIAGIAVLIAKLG